MKSKYEELILLKDWKKKIIFINCEKVEMNVEVPVLFKYHLIFVNGIWKSNFFACDVVFLK